MKKTYLKSYENYKPSLTQMIVQFFRCRNNKHIWKIYDVVENTDVVGELKECTHCGHSVSSFNIRPDNN